MDEQRSRIMRAVKSRNTRPEMTVRRLVHSMGYRYRLHRKDLPGKPDLAFISRRKAIFVHGCFWHGHDCPRGSREPKTNRDYWIPKIAKTRKRDKATMERLWKMDWKTLVIWECETKDAVQLRKRIQAYLT